MKTNQLTGIALTNKLVSDLGYVMIQYNMDLFTAVKNLKEDILSEADENDGVSSYSYTPEDVENFYQHIIKFNQEGQ